ncbi:MAG: general stress protein CsbD [Bacteroidota bacterium]|nr:general stress protein CsbD [Odoribacter sp.]MDP3644407.1 general stress protein CsbD [Bacteroidota bacterium]
MDTTVFKVNLIEEKGKLKQKFASLTDDDLLFEEGRQEELSAKYQAMFFQSEEELDQIISSF